MTSRTTLKLPERLKARIVALAETSGRTPGQLMVEAIEREVERRERIRAFVQEARKADRQIEETAESYAANDVHDWLEKLAARKRAGRPKPSRK